MQFTAASILALALAVSAAPAKRDDTLALPLPTNASVWLQTTSGDTEAFLTYGGQVWQWADENGNGPEALQLTVNVIPGSLSAAGDDALVELLNGGPGGVPCSLHGDFIECSSNEIEAFVFHAKLQTDVVGETRWFLLTEYGSWSTQQVKDELYQLSPKPDYGVPYNVYITDAV